MGDLPEDLEFEARLALAFNAVPRENFVGPGPWQVSVDGTSYIDTPSADAAYLYQDVLIALDRAAGINSGEPSLHAKFMSAIKPRPGETVVHVGAGMGYYSAVLCHLVESNGRVEAFEISTALAAARRNLSSLANASVIAGDATLLAMSPANVIYVIAGVVAPPLHWLKALLPGGRMLFPWRPTEDIAIALLIHRSTRGFDVTPLQSAWFIPCVGASDIGVQDKVPDADSAWRTRSLRFNGEIATDATATAVCRDIWFSSEPA